MLLTASRQFGKLSGLVLMISLIFVNACSREERPGLIDQIEKQNGFWKLAGGDAFLDGGSFCLSFLSEDGEVIHLFVLADNHREDNKLVVQLQRTYTDLQPVRVIEGSPLESGVIWLLENYQERPEVAIESAYAARLIEVIKDRTKPFPEYPRAEAVAPRRQRDAEGAPPPVTPPTR